MTERPMLFNSEMVRGILSGRKTQTRRPMKVQPDHRHRRIDFENGYLFESVQRNGCWHVEQKQACPFGVPGDRIWVRETWTPIPTHHGSGRPASYNDPNNRYYGRKAWYCADNDRPTWGGKWIPSIHMPRWACRIVLEITDVRVQRVQEITCADAIAEGIHAAANSQTIDCDTANPRDKFSALWDSCYGKTEFAWGKNPWVWALTFKRVEGETK